MRDPYHVTMDTNDATETAHAFSSSRIIAVHNDAWAHFTETQNDVGQAFGSAPILDVGFHFDANIVNRN